MISMVLYGRNDSYGYNLHKRAALSFNCMAELLTDTDDEILFVDYNTPDDFPTFPEAIQDTLTQQARKRLRILRVRPAIHERFRGKTRLVALEPISRNIAVRRSNPANRWILSTNTDMIFVPQTSQPSLSELSRDLPPGFYHAPRMEIPETLWESLDRQDPNTAIEMIKQWGRTLHLNEIVLGAKTIRYDGPGDFQLMQRSDLFKYDAFHEEMILGWHVDSNIAKRLYLVYGNVGDLGHAVFGYHCDHTRQITPMHSHTRTQNDWRRFIDNVDGPGVPEQSDTWGCNGEEIEEVRLSSGTTMGYVAALRSAIGDELETPPVVRYSQESYDAVGYDPRHVLPFLIDLFFSANRKTVIGWSGLRLETLALFARAWTALGFVEPLLVDAAAAGASGFDRLPGVLAVDGNFMLTRADAFVVDFGTPSTDAAGLQGNTLADDRLLGAAFLKIVKAERERMARGKKPRRVACLNAIHTRYEQMIVAQVAAGLTPFATRMRHGFVFPPQTGVQDWSAALHPGDAAIKDDSVIRALPGVAGMISFGPYRHLFSGRYWIEFKLAGIAAEQAQESDTIAIIELLWGEFTFGYGRIRVADVALGSVRMEIDVGDYLASEPGGLLQARVRTLLPTDLSILALTADEIDKVDPAAPLPATLSNGVDWLGVMQDGPVGERNASGAVTVQFGKVGIVAFGPHWNLLPGRYQIIIDVKTNLKGDEVVMFAEVLSEGRLRAAALLSGADAAGGTARIEFEVHAGENPAMLMPVELRLRTMKPITATVRSAIIRYIGEPVQASPWLDFPAPELDWLPFMSVTDQKGSAIAEGGRFGVVMKPSERGLVVYGPHWMLRPGRYEAELVLHVTEPSPGPLLHIEVVSDGLFRAVAMIRGEQLSAEPVRLLFEIHSQEVKAGTRPVEVRVQIIGAVDGLLRSVHIRRCGEQTEASPFVRFPKPDFNWLAFLRPGSAAMFEGVALHKPLGAGGLVAEGPTFNMPVDDYRLVLRGENIARDTSVLNIEIVVDDRHVELIGKKIAAAGLFELSLDLELSRLRENSVGGVLMRISGDEMSDFQLSSLTSVALREGDPRDVAERGELSLLPLLTIRQDAAHRCPAGVQVWPGAVGHVVFGPWWRLSEGSYVIRVRFTKGIAEIENSSRVHIAADVSVGGRYLAFVAVDGKNLQGNYYDAELKFDIDFATAGDPSKFFEFRIETMGITELFVESASMSFSPEAILEPIALRDHRLVNGDWLGFLKDGPGARREGDFVVASKKFKANVLHGPYWALHAGTFEAVFELATDALIGEPASLGSVDITRDQRIVARAEIDAAALAAGHLILSFNLNEGENVIEARVWTEGVADFRILAIRIAEV